MWFLIILCLLFLTPIGWIGMICLGAAIAMVVEAKNEARANLIIELKGRSECHTPEQLKEFVDGL